MTEPGANATTTAEPATFRPNRILILGIGKSGTTALMSAVCKATGLPYEMEPKSLSQLDYTKSFVAKKLIDTLRDQELVYIDKFDKVIIIVRDPRDALVSRLLYRPYGLKVFSDDRLLKRYLDLIDKKVADPRSVSVQQLINRLRHLSGHKIINVSANNNQRLLAIHEAYGSRALLLKYEDFIRNDYAVIDSYLGTSISSAFTVVPKYGRVLRKGGQGDWKDWFTLADCVYFDRQFTSIYATFGYAPEAPSETPSIDRATSIDYVIGIVNEWRANRGISSYNERLAEVVVTDITVSGASAHPDPLVPFSPAPPSPSLSVDRTSPVTKDRDA